MPRSGDEDTPRAVILALRPDVLVKGADYEKDRIVGATEVEGWGGRVVRVPVVDGMSTTRLVQAIRSAPHD
jgi:D-beta-D-heptose 7-phosphate kinase/D-beta-D-heptose 1-phosphate adenosyltransferase